MLINLTNHPSDKWSEKQLSEANKQFGKVVDYTFPNISPEWSENNIEDLANDIFEDIINRYKDDGLIIHIMGEFTFSYAIIKKFKSQNIKCVASTTSRVVSENPDGTKTSIFNFIQFREYK